MSRATEGYAAGGQRLLLRLRPAAEGHDDNARARGSQRRQNSVPTPWCKLPVQQDHVRASRLDHGEQVLAAGCLTHNVCILPLLQKKTQC